MLNPSIIIILNLLLDMFGLDNYDVPEVQNSVILKKMLIFAFLLCSSFLHSESQQKPL